MGKRGEDEQERGAFLVSACWTWTAFVSDDVRRDSKAERCMAMLAEEEADRAVVESNRLREDGTFCHDCMQLTSNAN